MPCGLSGGDCMADDRDKVSNQHPLSAVTQHDLQAVTARYASLSSGENPVREADSQLEENADPHPYHACFDRHGSALLRLCCMNLEKSGKP